MGTLKGRTFINRTTAVVDVVGDAPADWSKADMIVPPALEAPAVVVGEYV